MQGQLFTQDFLARGILETEPWRNLSEAELDAFVAELRGSVRRPVQRIHA